MSKHCLMLGLGLGGQYNISDLALVGCFYLVVVLWFGKGCELKDFLVEKIVMIGHHSVRGLNCNWTFV